MSREQTDSVLYVCMFVFFLYTYTSSETNIAVAPRNPRGSYPMLVFPHTHCHLILAKRMAATATIGFALCSYWIHPRFLPHSFFFFLFKGSCRETRSKRSKRSNGMYCFIISPFHFEIILLDYASPNLKYSEFLGSPWCTWCQRPNRKVRP